MLTGALVGSGRGRRLMPGTSSPAIAAAAAAMDPAFKVIPRNSTCFLIWRVEVCYVIVTMTTSLIQSRSTLFLHGVCMLCEYGECAHEQHVRRTLTPTLTLTHMITAYSVSGNVVCVHILVCATRQKPCRKRVYLQSLKLHAFCYGSFRL